jgi:hypothetical protein
MPSRVQHDRRQDQRHRAARAGLLQHAAGYQWSDGSLVTKPSDALFSGDIAGLAATQPIDRDRTVNAFFGELPF